MTPSELSVLTTLACLIEAGAPKPGNVSPGRPYRYMCYEDFVASAVAVGPELGMAGERSLGATILAAIRATRRWTPSNTNLGMILLLAPIVRAVRRPGLPAGGLRAMVAAELEETTVEDARLAYTAIRETHPGGLGHSGTEDVAGDPTVSLKAAMWLARDRDVIAREYVTDFALTFEVGAPAVRAAREAGLDWSDTTVEAFLVLLAREPDTLIARKLGRPAAERVQGEAERILASGGVRTHAGRAALAAFDADLRDTQNSRNPGTTADLTAAALLVTLIEDGWDTDRSRMARAQ